MKRGCAGADARDLQDGLIRPEYDVGASGVDGDFGKATEDAVKAFRTTNALTASTGKRRMKL